MKKYLLIIFVIFSLFIASSVSATEPVIHTHSQTINGSEFLDTKGQVIICDKPLWEECALKIEQKILSWSDIKIVFFVVKGHFNVGNVVYLYIVDFNGLANPQGFKMQITTYFDHNNVPRGLRLVSMP